MIHPAPPRFLQHILLALLSPRDQESVAGDLLEGYAERRATHGRIPANLWYARQITSFVPRATAAAYARTPALVFLCCFTAASGAWLGTMDIVLHHHNLLYHESIAGRIVGQGLLTLVMLPLRRLAWMRWAAGIGCIAIAWLGGRALIAAFRGADFEGYILIIAFMLVVQAALTWRVLLRRQPTAA